MRFLSVTNNKDMAILTDFINNLTEEIESFTYFNKRPFNIVLNHDFIIKYNYYGVTLKKY